MSNLFFQIYAPERSDKKSKLYVRTVENGISCTNMSESEVCSNERVCTKPTFVTPPLPSVLPLTSLNSSNIRNATKSNASISVHNDNRRTSSSLLYLLPIFIIIIAFILVIIVILGIYLRRKAVREEIPEEIIIKEHCKIPSKFKSIRMRIFGY